MELPEDMNLEDTDEQNEEGADEGRDSEGTTHGILYLMVLSPLMSISNLLSEKVE